MRGYKNKIPRSIKILLTILFIALLLFFSFLPNIKGSIKLQRFENLDVSSFKYIIFSKNEKNIRVTDKKRIGELLEIFKADTVFFYKEAGIMYDINLGCDFLTLNNENFFFEIYKMFSEDKVYIFFRNKGFTIYLNGLDRNFVLDGVNSMF